MTIAYVRDGSWADIGLCDLEGNPLDEDMVTELPTKVTAVCMDDSTGLYVLTADEGNYFTAPSIDLDFD
jgi:hypothetical protein